MLLNTEWSWIEDDEPELPSAFLFSDQPLLLKCWESQVVRLCPGLTLLPWIQNKATRLSCRRHLSHPVPIQKDQPLFTSPMSSPPSGWAPLLCCYGEGSAPLPGLLCSRLEQASCVAIGRSSPTPFSHHSSPPPLCSSSQVWASRGLGTDFRKFPVANANEGHSLLLKSSVQAQLCLPLPDTSAT